MSQDRTKTKKLLVEGGGDMPVKGAAKFHEWILLQRDCSSELGTTNLLLIPWASVRAPEELFEDFCVWMGFDAEHEERRNVVMAPPLNAMLEQSDSQATFFSQMSDCCAIFFCGGDQSDICRVVHGVPGVRARFHELYEQGLPFAGTSAGCAVMSLTMLTGEG